MLSLRIAVRFRALCGRLFLIRRYLGRRGHLVMLAGCVGFMTILQYQVVCALGAGMSSGRAAGHCGRSLRNSHPWMCCSDEALAKEQRDAPASGPAPHVDGARSRGAKRT